MRLFGEKSAEIICVLLDVTMPGMSGKEVLKQIREIRENAVVLFSSGFNEQEFADRYEGSGTAGFIQKPYELDTLRVKLSEILDRQSPDQPSPKTMSSDSVNP